MKLKQFQIYAILLAIVFTAQLGFARSISPFDEFTFQLDLNSDVENGKPLRNSTVDTTRTEYTSSFTNDPYSMLYPEKSVFMIGYMMSYSTNDFVVFGVNVEVGAPNLFEGLSFAFGMGTGWIASDSSQEFGFFFCVNLMVKYTFFVESFYYPGFGMKYLGGGAINLVGESKEYDTYGLMGFVSIPFWRVFLVEGSATLELITDDTHSVGICFDLLLGLHF